MRSWWVKGVGSRIAYLVVSVDIRPVYSHDVSASGAGVSFADSLSCGRLVDTVPFCWVLRRFRGPCHVPFVENVGCWIAEILPVVGIVPIVGG